MGIMWALLSALGFALFQTANRRAGLGIDVLFGTFLLILISALVLTGVALAVEGLTPLRQFSLFPLAIFSLAGLFHYAFGWTLLGLSQRELGAARAGALVGISPLFAVAIAWITLGEHLPSLALLGVAAIVAGVYLVSTDSRLKEFLIMGLRISTQVSTSHLSRGIWWGLGAAVCWAIDPVFVRWGLRAFPFPLWGAALSLLACVGIYGGLLRIRRPARSSSPHALGWQILAALLVALATWLKWLALQQVSVGIVLALGRLSVPLVVLLSPLIVGRSIERLTLRLGIGAGLITLGTFLLIGSG
jgi:drug/metabolite transporter (DMT)-like permease